MQQIALRVFGIVVVSVAANLVGYMLYKHEPRPGFWQSLLLWMVFWLAIDFYLWCRR